MSVLVAMSMDVKPESRDQLEGWLKAETRHTRAFEGCISVSIHVDQQNPHHLFVLGHWESPEHHEQYMAWRAEKGDVEELMAWMATPPTAHRYDEFLV